MMETESVIHSSPATSRASEVRSSISHNGDSHLSTSCHQGNSSFSKGDASFGCETDPDTLNCSSDTFQTPSGKLLHQGDTNAQVDEQLCRSAQVRQTLFQFDPLSESQVTLEGPSFNLLDTTQQERKSCASQNTTLNTTERLIAFNTSQPNGNLSSIKLISLDTPARDVHSVKVNGLTSPFTNTALLQSNGVYMMENESKEQLSQLLTKYEQCLAQIPEMEQKVQSLEGDNQVLIEQVTKLTQENEKLTVENNALQAQMTAANEKYEEVTKLNQSMVQGMNAITDAFEEELDRRNENIEEINFRCTNLLKDKEQALEDVQGLEASFAELHRRYEKLKSALEQCRQNEELYKSQCLELSETLEEKEKVCTIYQNQAEKSEENAKHLIENSKRSTDRELTSLRAQLKKTEMRVNGLQAQLDQKISENTELNQMIDELTKS